jgi:hypothetical protein
MGASQGVPYTCGSCGAEVAIKSGVGCAARRPRGGSTVRMRARAHTHTHTHTRTHTHTNPHTHPHTNIHASVSSMHTLRTLVTALDFGVRMVPSSSIAKQ